MTQELRFDEKVVVVTGAGRGLGQAYALDFARRGARVVVNDLGGDRVGIGASDSPAKATVDRIVAAGGEAVANFDDISTDVGGSRVVDTAIEAFGRIDVLINNAGIAGGWSLADSTNELFERFWRVHLLGHVNVIRAAWPHFVQQGGGRVVNTTSGASLWGMEGQAVYGSAKGAINGLTKVLAVDGAPHGIIVNAVGPAAYTRVQSEVIDDPQHRVLAQRTMRIDLVVPAVIYLAHSSADVTGEIYEAFSGRVGRVVTGEVPGFYDADLTAESLQENWTVAVGENSEIIIPSETLQSGGLLLDAAIAKNSGMADVR